ncbi:long-chain fatty acid transport protein 2-like [Glandiceps talaboti]
MGGEISYTLLALIAGIFGVLIIPRLYYPYIFSDLCALVKYGSILRKNMKFVKSGYYPVDMFMDSTRRQPTKPCLIYKEKVYTYADINRRSNQLANFAQRENLKFGDTVAFIMYNEPFFVWAWLGLAKLGIKCSLINYNLRTKSLIHSLTVTNVKTVIVGEGKDLLAAVMEISDYLNENNINVWLHGHDNDEKIEHFREITLELENAPDDEIPKERRQDVKGDNESVYIYTSGTTGLPKACNITHQKHIGCTLLLDILDLTEDDVFYITLPLYHSSAFLITLAYGLRKGATMVLAQKFSASRFWQDVRKHDVTVIFYIGEVCRYLLAQPERTEDRNHKVRFACGNGLRTDIWVDFARRFAIPHIGEFYGATEGNIFTCNVDNKVGSCGRMTPLIQKLGKYRFVQYEFDTATPIRGADGRCLPAETGKPGLLLTPIDEVRAYKGYRGKKELTESKKVSNVFKDGDLYFNTGDIFTLDKDYYMYFNDRLGDTFRWKGENVSTTEVANVVMNFYGIKEVNVYGVSVTGQEGRAGMAAVVLEDKSTFSFKQFYIHMTTSLPLYACPKFLRLKEQLDVTGTFKYTKTGLVKEGFDPEVISDPLYFMSMEQRSYVPLDVDDHKHIMQGGVKI